MSAVERVADFWDVVTANSLAGDDDLPSVLEPWFASYAAPGLAALPARLLPNPTAAIFVAPRDS